MESVLELRMGRCFGNGILWGAQSPKEKEKKGGGKRLEKEGGSRTRCRVPLASSVSGKLSSAEIKAKTGRRDPEGRGRITEGALESEGNG